MVTAASTRERTLSRAFSALRAAGVRTFAIVQPMFPGSVEGLAEALAHRVTSARLDVLYGTYGATRELAEPRFAHVPDARWQEEQRAAIAAALERRGVKVWPGELP